MFQAILKRSLSLVLIFAVIATVEAAPAAVDDHVALGDLKVGKGVFLVDIGEAKKLNFYLGIIQGTYKGMVRQGVKPDFVVVYIGPSVKYLTQEPSDAVEEEAGGLVLDIAANVEALGELGIRQEICAVATGVFGVDNATLLPELTLVGDGFISLIGYQAQGYHLVPVF